jgi:diguanylate cyclase (GGDEF)-like protein/PAS domain S-box-containing protein
VSERLLQDFAEIASDWFWEMDSELRFSFFSSRLQEFAGVEPDREIGKSRLEIAANSQNTAFWEPHIEDLLARRPFRNLVYPYNHKDGHVRWFRISGQPRFGPDGEFLGYRGVGTDITAQHKAQERLAEAHAELQRMNDQLARQNLQFDTALNNKTCGLCMFDGERRLIVCNRRYAEMYELPPELSRPGTPYDSILAHRLATGLYPKMEAEEYVAQLRATVTERRPESRLLELRDGRAFAIAYQPMPDGGWVATHEDVTERKEAEAALAEQNRRFDAALNNMAQGLCMYDADGRLIVCNSRYAELYKLPAELSRPGTLIDDIIEYRLRVGAGPRDLKGYRSTGLTSAFRGSPSDYRLELQDGRTMQISHKPMIGGGWVATIHDASDAMRAEARIRHMARHDALTGLANRVLFREEMEKALHRVRRGDRMAVLCLDLDHFKSVNDTLGHPVGDGLLKSVTDRLRACLGETDTVARLGGDEFAILQVGIDEPEAAAWLARRVIEAVSEPYEIEGHQVVVGASVGIAVAPNNGADADQLLRNADMALYRAKSDGRGVCRFFEPQMDAQLQARRSLELALRKALAKGEFELFYQPLLDLRTDEISGCEALLRWNHPERGLVFPAEFIPLAEEIGLIVPLGELVLRQACLEAAKWPRPIKVAVNLSPAQFKSRNLVAAVVRALAASGLAASRLELEITETVLLLENEATVKTLHELRGLGVRISMDDFGTGYSSLSYLRSFPFDKIKIDQSFVRDLSDKQDCAAIIRAVAGLGSSLGMTTTAEGVETIEQLDQVIAEGCTEVQGYLFSPPRRASELPRIFEERAANALGTARSAA